MNKFNILLISAILSLSACSTGDIKQFVTGSTHLALLDAEWEHAEAIIQATPFNEQERQEIEVVRYDLNHKRKYLKNIYKGTGSEVILAGLQGQSFVNEAETSLIKGLMIYRSYLDRTGLEPNPDLVATYNSALLSIDNARKVFASGGGITGVEATETLGLVLRVLIATQGIPI